MSGKQNFKNIKSPKDLFTLPQDSKFKNRIVKIDKKRQAASVERHKKMLSNH